MGNLKDEIVDEFGEGSKIFQMVCVAPKHYAYTVVKEDGERKESVKMKGYRQNLEVKKICNFIGTKSLIETTHKNVTFTNEELKRETKSMSIYSVMKSKEFRVQFDKRVVDLETFKTVPIGYRVSN